MRTRLITAAACGLLVAALTGCTVSVTDTADGEATSSAESSAPEDPVAESSTDADDDEPAETPAGPSAWSAETAADRDAALASVTKKVTCAGELTIAGTGQIMQVDGACDRLIITMSAGVVIAGSVDVLEVNGDGGIAYVDSVQELNVTGDAVVVHWLGATPTVDDSGAANALTAG